MYISEQQNFECYIKPPVECSILLVRNFATTTRTSLTDIDYYFGRFQECADFYLWFLVGQFYRHSELECL